MDLIRTRYLLPLLFGCARLTAGTVGLGNVTTIDFNGLPGNNMDPFSTFSENGYTISSTAGAWSVATLVGFPPPDIDCSNCDLGRLAVTNVDGEFYFDSIGLLNSGTSDANITIAGFLDSVQFLSETISLALGLPQVARPAAPGPKWWIVWSFLSTLQYRQCIC